MIITVIATVMSIGIITITNEKMYYIPSIALYNEPRVQASEEPAQVVADCIVCALIDNYIVVKPSVDKATAKLGDTLHIPVTFTYVSERYKDREITIQMGNIYNIHVSASLTQRYTDKELDAIINRCIEGSSPLPYGIIDKSKLMQYVPDRFTLHANESRIVDLYVTIPDSLPEEMSRESIGFSIYFTTPPEDIDVKVNPRDSILSFEVMVVR
ncbi:MAG: hypothetical protein QW712_02520 [Candidatus Nitrosocaldus sp.]